MKTYWPSNIHCERASHASTPKSSEAVSIFVCTRLQVFPESQDPFENFSPWIHRWPWWVFFLCWSPTACLAGFLPASRHLRTLAQGFNCLEKMVEGPMNGIIVSATYHRNELTDMDTGWYRHVVQPNSQSSSQEVAGMAQSGFLWRSCSPKSYHLVI